MSETTLVEKLIQLRKKVPYIKKEQKQYIKFSVVSSETVLTEFNTHMNELNIYLKTEVVNKTIERQKIAVNEKTKKDIFSYLVTLDMKYTWINGDNPSEREEVTFSAIADDENSSYAYGQALTYAEKTFFMKEFNIPADDVDPDVFQKEILKRIPASPEQIEAIHIQLGKLEELTEQPKLAFLEQAKMTNGVNAKKAPEEFTGYDFGIVMNTLTGWVNGYEKKKSKK
nr:MAG TPA: ERF superfamily protein [Caudoviricetes sp.]